MPIEIRELHIKVNVTSAPGPQAGSGAQKGVGGKGADPEAQRANEDELVSRCVEQVLELLRDRDER